MENPVCPVCGEVIKPREREPRGRKREYCSDRCRKIAARAKSMVPAELLTYGTYNAPVDEQVKVAFLEAQRLHATFARLGLIARPQHRWRCAIMADHMKTGLSEGLGDS